MVDESDLPLTWKRVAERLDERPRGSAYQLSKRLGMNSSYFYRKLKSGGELTESQARLVRDFLGEGPPPSAGVAPPSGLRDRDRLPVFGYAAGDGGDRISLNETQVLDWLELPMGIALGPGEWFVVIMPGSQMEPRIFPGEKLVVRKGYPPARDQDVVVELEDGSALVKTYKGQRDGQIFLEQFNERKTLNVAATGARLHAVAFRL